ncbi:MAG: hypothetical protein HFH34_07945 [Eubacterium sp.]|nr:hypothetical protein [Eubacterium sp.]
MKSADGSPGMHLHDMNDYSDAYYHSDKTGLLDCGKEVSHMLEKNDLTVLDENRAAVILLRVLLEKGSINQKTFDRVAKIYAIRLKEAA